MAGSSALVAALVKTLGEVLRASLGAFSAVLVGLQLAVRAGIMMLFKPAADETSRMSEQTPPHMVSSNAHGLCGIFGRVAVDF